VVFVHQPGLNRMGGEAGSSHCDVAFCQAFLCAGPLPGRSLARSASWHWRPFPTSWSTRTYRPPARSPQSPAEATSPMDTVQRRDQAVLVSWRKIAIALKTPESAPHWASSQPTGSYHHPPDRLRGTTLPRQSDSLAVESLSSMVMTDNSAALQVTPTQPLTKSTNGRMIHSGIIRPRLGDILARSEVARTIWNGSRRPTDQHGSDLHRCVDVSRRGVIVGRGLRARPVKPFGGGRPRLRRTRTLKRASRISTYQYRFIHQTLYCFSRWPSAQCAQ
jgi:hypothetical protein